MHSSASENIPRKIRHLKIVCGRGKECTFTNKWYTKQLKNPKFQEQLIFNDKYDCYSPYQKHQYGLFFPYPKTSSVCFAPYKTTVLNRIHEIFKGSRKRKNFYLVEFVKMLYI